MGVINTILKVEDYYYYNNYSFDDKYNAPVLCLNCITKNKEQYLVRIVDKENLTPMFGLLREEWYDYYGRILLMSNSKATHNYVTKLEDAPETPYGDKTVRLYTNFPWQVSTLKNNYVKSEKKPDAPFSRTFYADVKWEKMAISKVIKLVGLDAPYIDVPEDFGYKYLKVSEIKKPKKEDYFVVESRIDYWDIESDARSCGSKIVFDDYKLMPILSITGYDNWKDEYHVFVWHYTFEKNKIIEHDNYKIIDNINGYEHTLRKVFMHQFTNEIEMIKEYANWFGSCRFANDFGFYSAGGYKVIKKRRKWFDGYDNQAFFARAKYLGLHENIQIMSTCPVIEKKYTGYEGVYMRRDPRNYKHEVVMKGVGHIDLVFSNEVLGFTKKFEQFRGSGLKDYASFFLDYNKLDKKGKRVWWLWENDLKFMIDYNIIDVKICVDLDKKFKISKQQRSRIEVSISPFEDALKASNLHDHYKLTHYQDKYSFDTKYQKFYTPPQIRSKEQIGDQFTIDLKFLEDQAKTNNPDAHYETLYDIRKVGGLVMEPAKRGIYKNVLRLDFSKFYPNMIICTNAGIISAIDFDKEFIVGVRDRKGKMWNKADLVETPMGFFRKDVQSINTELFNRWMTERVTAQKELQKYLVVFKTTKSDMYYILYDTQFNIKNFMNAGFGVLGLEIDRIFCLLAYNSCTVSCQDVMLLVIRKLHEWGFTVIQNDTDSAMLLSTKEDKYEMEKEGLDICDKLNVIIEKYMKEVYNVDENKIKIGLETIADKYYVDGKKHYIQRNIYVEGVWLDKPELEVKGMDLKKRSTSKIGADNQINIVNSIFNDKEPLDSIREYVNETDGNIEDMEWSYLCKRGPINMHLEEYNESTQSATGARNMLKYFGKYYDPGSNPYIAVFKKFPKIINNKRIEEREGFVLSFEEEDVLTLKELGFELDYYEIRRSECGLKTNHLLGMFNENWDSLLEEEVGGFLMI